MVGLVLAVLIILAVAGVRAQTDTPTLTMTYQKPYLSLSVEEVNPVARTYALRYFGDEAECGDKFATPFGVSEDNNGITNGYLILDYENYPNFGSSGEILPLPLENGNQVRVEPNDGAYYCFAVVDDLGNFFSSDAYHNPDDENPTIELRVKDDGMFIVRADDNAGVKRLFYEIGAGPETECVIPATGASSVSSQRYELFSAERMNYAFATKSLRLVIDAAANHSPIFKGSEYGLCVAARDLYGNESTAVWKSLVRDETPASD